MKTIAIFTFWVSLSFGAIGWLALAGLSAECYFSPPSTQNNVIYCYAVAITVSRYLLFIAAALAALSYLWLPWKKQRLVTLIVIVPGLFLLTRF